MDHLSNLIRSKCDVFSLKKGQSVDASFDYRRGFESQQPEISDIAISSDSKNMACILPGKEGAQKPASLYVAPVASANECTWVEELDWPATEISDLSFPTANDIYFVVRPKVSIRSHEDKAILAHVCHASKRLETVRIESAVSFSFFFSFPFGYIESCLRILTIELLRALIIVEATSAFSLPSPPSMNCSIHVP
jgi:hypothetical protein